MQVAILGAGSIAFGMAAFLCEAGHDPILWSPSGKRTQALAAGAKLVSSGAVAGTFAPRAAASCAEALASAEAVIVAVPGNGHRAVMDAAAPHLRPGQTVIISSHCSLSALYLSKLLAGRGVSLPIAALGTTLVSGRQTGPDSVTVTNVRQRIDVASLPASAAEAGLAVCRALMGDRLQPRADLLAIALSNLNPQNHMAMAMCNMTRIERGEAWGNYAGITGTVGRLIEALDAERLAIAGRVGVQVRTVREHFHLSFDVPLTSVAEQAAVLDGRGTAPLGPNTIDTRYVLEDVPFGLVPSELIGRIAGVPTPLHTGGIELFGALYGRDFRAENDILPDLGIDGLSAAELGRLCREGY
jgi:opine dehydrogenase